MGGEFGSVGKLPHLKGLLGRDQKRFLQATEKTAVVDVENHQLHFSTG